MSLQCPFFKTAGVLRKVVAGGGGRNCTGKDEGGPLMELGTYQLFWERGMDCSVWVQ